MIRYDLPTWANPPTVERAVEWLTSSMDEMDAHSGSSLRVLLDRLAELEAAAVQNRAARQVLKNANKRQRVVIDDLCQRLSDGRQVIE